MKVNLQIRETTCPLMKHQHYIRVNFNRRMTWKNKIDQCTRRANLRMALMKKFSGSSWERITAFRRSSKRAASDQCWSTEYLLGGQLQRLTSRESPRFRIRPHDWALRSTPIQKKRRKTTHAICKFKRLGNHPIHNRMYNPIKAD